MSVTRNPNLGSSQAKAKRRRLFLVRFYIVLFFVLVIVFGLAILSGHEKIKIQNITVVGNAAVSTDDILNTVNRDLGGRYGYLFAKSNYLIFPRFQICKDLLSEFKIIKDVDASWDTWQNILITVEERKPQSTWCGNDVKVLEPECYFADKEGYVFSQAPTFSGNMYVRYYGNLFDTNPVGQYFLPKETYQQINNLIQVLDQKGFRIVHVYFDGFDYKFTLDIGPVIIFNDNNGFNSSFENLLSAIETNNLDLIKDANIINYIDLRFDNKVVIGKKENKTATTSQTVN